MQKRYTIQWSTKSRSSMITVVKLTPSGEAKIQYQGEIIKHLTDGVVVLAYWRQPTKDLGYTCFEPGDQFIEYYYSDRWYNIFAIATADGHRKGWYCNIAEPAHIFADHIEQIDLLLDVWVNPDGTPLILDEDEFASDTKLSDRQRAGAPRALQELLQVIAA